MFTQPALNTDGLQQVSYHKLEQTAREGRSTALECANSGLTSRFIELVPVGLYRYS